MPSRVVVLVVAVLALAACGGGSGGGGDEPRNAGEADGLTLYEVRSHGFTIGVPGAWKVLSAEDLDKTTLEQLARENPEFAPYFKAVSDPRSPLKLVAVDPEVRDDFATNVNVAVQDVPEGVTFEEFARAGLGELERLAVGDVESETVSLPAGKAQKLTYRLEFSFRGRKATISQTQYAVLGGDKGYGITFSTLPPREREYAGTFERIVESFRLVG